MIQGKAQPLSPSCCFLVQALGATPLLPELFATALLLPLCFAPISAQAQNLAAFSWSHLTNLSLSEVVVVNVVVITVVVFVIVEDLLPTPLAPLDPGRGSCQTPNLATASQSSPPSFPLRGHPSSPGDPLGELCARPWTKD